MLVQPALLQESPELCGDVEPHVGVVRHVANECKRLICLSGERWEILDFVHYIWHERRHVSSLHLYSSHAARLSQASAPPQRTGGGFMLESNA